MNQVDVDTWNGKPTAVQIQNESAKTAALGWLDAQVSTTMESVKVADNLWNCIAAASEAPVSQAIFRQDTALRALASSIPSHIEPSPQL
jgi:hypothetical protein